MFKRLLLLGSFAFLPAVAMGNSAALDNAGTRTMEVVTGQGPRLTITIPNTPNSASIQAPYALTGADASAVRHDYRQVFIGQGGWVQIPAD